MAVTGEVMTMSGFCAFPSPGSHGFCHSREGRNCSCACHTASTPPTSEGFGELLVARALDSGEAAEVAG